MTEQSIWIRRPILNADEIYDHFADQKILKRLIPKSRLQIGLSFTPRQLDPTKITLQTNLEVIDPLATPPTLQVYGRNRVLVQELNSLPLTKRQQTLHDMGATFFELENWTPHIVLDFNLSDNIQWTHLKPFTDPIILKAETLSTANLGFRSTIHYRQLSV